MNNITQAVVFCGGKGKRLYPLTKNIPKPMVMINGYPFLYYLINHLKINGFKEVLLLTGYKSKIIENYFSDRPIKGIKIIIKKTPVNWMTNKRLCKIKNYLNDFFLLLYCDNLVHINLKKLIKSADLDNLSIHLMIQHTKLAKERGNIKVVGKFARYYKKRNSNNEYVELGYMIINKKIIKIINCDNVSFSDTIQNLSKKNMLSHYKTTLRYFSITNVKNLKDVEKNLHYHQVKYLKGI